MNCARRRAVCVPRRRIRKAPLCERGDMGGSDPNPSLFFRICGACGALDPIPQALRASSLSQREPMGHRARRPSSSFVPFASRNDRRTRGVRVGRDAFIAPHPRPSYPKLRPRRHSRGARRGGACPSRRLGGGSRDALISPPRLLFLPPKGPSRAKNLAIPAPSRYNQRIN